ncbi:C-C chemokine receptor type 7 [Brienomyrus brachyistius]|uniref:C-C chemokine receptor type 7 n=1 Tax=Brienomyrus brachyistius TaxID=42636 RepID=UPI0020B22CA0|nr:C-C chemokine receptor type 7 [Brienomyrus brachyistius]
MYTFIGATLPGILFFICTFYVKTCMSLDNVTEKGPADDYSTDTLDMDYSAYVIVCEKQLNRKFRDWFMPTIYSLICFVGLVGNLLVILTYVYFKRLKTMTDVYLLNLAGADLLFVLTLPFWAASFLDEWMLGQFLCKAMYSIYKLSFYSGMLLLTCISVDRYFAIARAISAHRHRTRAVYFSKVSSVVLWTLALLFSVPEMAYTGVNDNRTCTIINSGEKNVRMTIQIGQMIAGFVLPAVVMGFCYCGIVQTLMQAQNFEKNKAIKVIFAVVAVFLLFQLPYNIAMLIATINTISGGSKDCVSDNKLLFAIDITQSLAFTRCCLNPFLYAFIGVKFRHDLFKLLKDLGCVSQERFFQYTTCSRKRSFDTKDTETTTSFSP